MDEIQGGNGNDVLDGGRGNDLIAGENHDDTIRGGDGNDVLDGHGGRDLLSGGDGMDILLAADSTADQLYGGADGDDLVGSGKDRLFGGAGADYCPREDGSSCGIEEDQRMPRAVGSWVSRARVDLSEDRALTLGVRVADDLGLSSVELWMERDGIRLPTSRRISLSGLKSGTARSGTWRLVGTVAEDAQPGTYRLRLRMTDRADKTRVVDTSRTVTVVR